MRSRLSLSFIRPVVGRRLTHEWGGSLANDQRLTANGLSYRSALDLSLEKFSLKNSLYVNAGGVDRVRFEFADLDQMLNFRNRNCGGSGHHWIKIPRCLAIHQVAPLVALPCFDKCKIRLEGALHQIWASIELAGFFVFADDRAYSGGGIEGRNTGAAGANPLGKSSLRHQVQLQLALQDQLLEQFFFPHVGPDVLDNLAGRQQESVAQSVHPDVVADSSQILHALADQGADQIFRNATQPESANHDGGAIGDVFDGLVGTGYDFVHRPSICGTRILNENQARTHHGDTEQLHFLVFSVSLCLCGELFLK